MGNLAKIIMGFLVLAALRFARGVAFQTVVGNSPSPSVGSRLADSAGVGGLSRADLSVMTGGTLIYCFVVGLVAHLVLGDKGLGRSGNSSIAFLGVMATMFVYSHLWGIPVAEDMAGLIVACVFTSTLAIAAAAFVKFFILNEAMTFALGGKTSLSKLSTGRSAKGPTADRLNMALKREGFH